METFSPEIQELLLALTFGDSLSGFNGSSYYNYGTMGLNEFGNLVFGSFTLDDIIANQGELYLSSTVGEDTYIPWASWGISDNNGPNDIERVGWEEVSVGREYEIFYSVIGGLIALPIAVGTVAAIPSSLGWVLAFADVGIGAIVGTTVDNLTQFPGQVEGDQIIIEQYKNSQGDIWQHKTIIRNDQIISYEEYFVIDFSTYNYP